LTLSSYGTEFLSLREVNRLSIRWWDDEQ
jgi:hypothetical protein